MPDNGPSRREFDRLERRIDIAHERIDRADLGGLKERVRTQGAEIHALRESVEELKGAILKASLAATGSLLIFAGTIYAVFG